MQPTITVTNVEHTTPTKKVRRNTRRRFTFSEPSSHAELEVIKGQYGKEFVEFETTFLSKQPTSTVQEEDAEMYYCNLRKTQSLPLLKKNGKGKRPEVRAELVTGPSDQVLGQPANQQAKTPSRSKSKISPRNKTPKSQPSVNNPAPRWAAGAFANSPPPSSLPIPIFDFDDLGSVSSLDKAATDSSSDSETDSDGESGSHSSNLTSPEPGTSPVNSVSMPMPLQIPLNQLPLSAKDSPVPEGFRSSMSGNNSNNQPQAQASTPYKKPSSLPRQLTFPDASSSPKTNPVNAAAPLSKILTPACSPLPSPSTSSSPHLHMCPLPFGQPSSMMNSVAADVPSSQIPMTLYYVPSAPTAASFVAGPAGYAMPMPRSPDHLEQLSSELRRMLNIPVS